MQLLSMIPPRHRFTARLTRKANAPDENDRAFYFWRLLVKQRIYKRHKDLLAQLDRLERVDKLEETLVGVIDEYTRLLKGAEKRADLGGDEAVGNGVAAEERKERGRKRVVMDDEDEESEEAIPAKKARTSDSTLPADEL